MRISDWSSDVCSSDLAEVADLMIGQNNFTAVFARVLLAATPKEQLAKPPGKAVKSTEPPNSQQLARMERELVILQTRIKSVEENYGIDRSEEHTSELKSLMRISYAVFCLKKKKQKTHKAKQKNTLLHSRHYCAYLTHT